MTIFTHRKMRCDAIYQARQAGEIDRLASAQHGISGLALMRRAGCAAFKQIVARYRRIKHMVVVCGAGNNGGDGYVVALCARRIGMAVTVVASAKPSTADAVSAWREYRAHGGVVREQSVGAAFATADLLVDGLFGTGLRRAPQGAHAELIERMNKADCPVVSLDMPSGLHSDTGLAFAPCVTATLTITFVGLKLGALTGQGRSQVGELVVEDLGIPAAARRAVSPVARILPPPTLAKRPREIHKGEAGHVLVVGGARGMLGATLLAGEAALRGGSGLVSIAGSESHLDWHALRCPELMSRDALQVCPQRLAAWADAVVLGNGLGQSQWSEQVFARFIDCGLPLVVDADALTWLARQPRRCATWVLTPHVGEAARLLASTPAEIQADRWQAAHAIAQKFGGVCVLKGAGTLVVCAAEQSEQADPGGATWLCQQGNAGMASAGMGDVLAGLIGALLGQRMELCEAAGAAVWLHANAADRAANELGERSLLARDVIAHLAPLMRALESA